MKYRVFKGHITWSYALFFFPLDISFKEIKMNLGTRFLNQEDYVGEFTFDEKFLSIFDVDQINGKKYYQDFLFEHDDYKPKTNITVNEPVKTKPVKSNNKTDFDMDSLF